MKWILVVDDSPLMLQMMEEALQAPGVRVTTASDALQGFIQARDLRPAVVICDLQMPNFGTGDQTLRDLRKDARLAGIPFIFVSAMEMEKAQLLVPQGDPTVRLLSKPVDWGALKQMITEMAGIKFPAEETPPAET